MRILSSRAIGALVCLFALHVFVVASSFAQDRPIFGGRTGDGTSTNPLDQLRQRLQQSAAAGNAIVMEGAVDPQLYVVGPGDVFTVSVGGAQPIAVTVPISADGRLVLPSGEVIAAGSRLLDEVREEAVSVLRRRYQNVAVDVSLAQPRQFYVHVTGAVPAPGRYLALPVARVSDVLQLAFIDTTNAPVANPAFRPSLRNINLTRRDGSKTSVDLARYLSSGATDQNPYVRDGDVITVPAYSITRRAVFVNGAVPFPGAYDYRPGDSVRDLLTIAGLDPGYGTVAHVRLARRQEDGSVASWTYSAADLASGSAEVPVQPLDHVSVLAEERLAGTAEVEGAVRFPGTYSITPGRTSLQDLVELAGGLREDALVGSAYITRDVLPTPEIPVGRQNRFEERLMELNALRPDTVAIMQLLRQAPLDFMSRTQFAQGLRIQNRVAVDLSDALSENAAPVHLQDKDRVVVPFDRSSVFVFGQVQRPGYVAFDPGRDVNDYIALAGGRNELSDDAYVVKSGTGRYVEGSRASIESGDLVFVDSNRDIADTPELQRMVLEDSRARAQARTQWITAASSVVFSLVSLITFIRSVR